MTPRKDILENMRIQARQKYLSTISPMNEDKRRQAPDIIVTLMDDMGWGDVSAFGSKAIHTPNLDRFEYLVPGTKT